MKTTQLFLVAVFFSLISCQSNEVPTEEFTEKTYSNVDEELWEYYREFEAQAALRGIEIDLNSYGTGIIEELSPNGVAGQCTYGQHLLADVVIDQSFWTQANSYLLREMVVFHELGHCYLKRGHEEGILNNGACASIMRSGLEQCRDNYTSVTRSGYLDELFSTVTP